MNAVVYGYLNVEGNNNNNNEDNDNNNDDNNKIKISKEAYEIIKNNNKRIEEEKITKIKLINESKNSLIEKRNLYLGKCQTFYTSDPFIVSRAFMQYIYDEQGNRFIDCISNVQHVGHCHPLIVQSIATQSSLSTCNIRFVCPLLGECSKLLINTLSSSNFDTIFYCNSGSEANDLALQLVKDWTKANDVIVLENAYHGHITSTAQLSPYKSEHGANIKKPDWVHIAPVPDVYRGKYKLIDSELNSSEALFRIGELYSKDVCNLIEEINKKGKKVAAFFAEALQSCGGQIIPPSGYFQSVAKAIHNNGGLLVIDEIQTGFGRVGETFWAHQLYKNEKEFIPDIITMGKSMGNGYPVAAVVTRKEIADKLCGNVEYFNTYGGNPVACAATLSVLQIIEKDNLLKHSKEMGILFKQKLELLKSKHLCIGDIRGIGMFWGLDLVKCRKTREPATNLASKLILKLRKEYGILLNADGPFTNILKFKPPLCFNSDNLENVIKSLDECLNELNNENN